jgi:multimeric flavodoxin WrbA
MSKAIAINGSPRTEKGYTALLLNTFVEGMTAAGSDVEVLYASQLEIKPCACGEMYCWYKKPGECCFQDDMQSLYPKLQEAETLILATPMYIPLPGAMQSFINRLCPLVNPLLETRDGRTRARFRDDVNIKRLVLVAVGGWWEVQNLATVVRIVEELAEDASVEFAGAVLRPHAFVMKKGGDLTEVGQAVLTAVRQAGRELVKQGAMGEDTLEAISRPLCSQEELRDWYNQWV